MRQRLSSVLALLAAFCAGAIFGYVPLRSKVVRCEVEKATLTNDLKRAVVRGLAAETQLNLCKGEKK